MTQFQDPDLNAPEEERPSTFVKTADLMERHVIIVPKAVRTVPGTQKNDRTGKVEDWTFVEADVVVLDGRETDKIPDLPHVVFDMRLSGYEIVRRLKKYAGTGDKILGVMTKEDKTNVIVPASAKMKGSGLPDQAWQLYLSEVEDPSQFSTVSKADSAPEDIPF